MKRASSSRIVTNCFNIEHHYQATVWGHARSCDTYLQTIDWLLLANNGEALFVKGMENLCTGHPGAVQLLARAMEEGHQSAAFMLGVLNYYKHITTEDVFNLFRCVYGEVTTGYQVGSLSWTDEGIDDEANASTARVHHRVDEEIGRVMWREQINVNIVYELHMPDDRATMLMEEGIGPVVENKFYSLRCKIRKELW
jgi:hypothetical protein